MEATLIPTLVGSAKTLFTHNTTSTTDIVSGCLTILQVIFTQLCTVNADVETRCADWRTTTLLYIFLFNFPLYGFVQHRAGWRVSFQDSLTHAGAIPLCFSLLQASNAPVSACFLVALCARHSSNLHLVAEAMSQQMSLYTTLMCALATLPQHHAMLSPATGGGWALEHWSDELTHAPAYLTHGEWILGFTFYC